MTIPADIRIKKATYVGDQKPSQMVFGNEPEEFCGQPRREPRA